MGCDHKIVLKKDMSCGGHVFLEYMSFRLTRFMRAYVLREVMLCWSKCLVGGQVLVESMSSGWHIL